MTTQVPPSHSAQPAAAVQPPGRAEVPATIVQRLHDVAAAAPDRNAVVGRGLTPLSYADLSRRVDAFAHGLVALGVGPGAVVALCLGASQATAVAIHALFQIGATVVPMPADQPLSRIKAMVDDTQPVVVITPADSADLSATGLHQAVSDGVLVVGVSADGVDWTAGLLGSIRMRPAPLPSGEEDLLAYVMFTSGSTGRPKGVMVSHRNLRTFLDAWTAVVGVPGGRFAGDGTAWLWLTTVAFDPVIVELVWALTNGATVVIPERTSTGPDVAGAISQFGVTHLQCTPTRASLFLADPVERGALGAVSHMLVGGEVMTPGLARAILDLGVGRLTNIYGPTETTVWALAAEVTRQVADIAGAGSIPLGRPTRGTIALVVDERGEQVPAGAEGELWLGGADVALGYIGNTALTDEVFVQARTCHRSVSAAVGQAGGSDRLYRTGDLVRCDDGVFWFVGRRDGQVKIRGHRIETSEVEAAIESCTAVQRAAVVAVGEAGSPERRLVAFLTGSLRGTDHGASATADEFVREVRAHSASMLLPAHVPTDWHAVSSLPLTATGKLDRRALVALAETSGGSPDLSGTQPNPGVSLPPVPALTNDLVLLFADVIGTPTGPSDDFFSAGGDSTGAVELFARLTERFGQRFPLRLLAEAGSPALLADRLHTYEQGGDGVLVDFATSDRSAPVLYLVHGAGGTVIGFAELAAALAPAVRLVGVQAIGTDGTHSPDLSVAAMADRYAAAIADRHRSQGGGPLHLGGYSDGGLIAVVTAALLAERGFSIRPVLLLDAFLGTHVPAGVVGKFAVATRNLADHPSRSLTRHVLGAWRGWRVRHTTLQRDHQLAERMTQLGHRDLFDVVVAACAQAGGTPPSQRVEATLIRCGDYNPSEQHDYSWIDRFCSSGSLSWTTGHHLSMLRAPNAERLAAEIRRTVIEAPGRAR